MSHFLVRLSWALNTTLVLYTHTPLFRYSSLHFKQRRLIIRSEKNDRAWSLRPNHLKTARVNECQGWGVRGRVPWITPTGVTQACGLNSKDHAFGAISLLYTSKHLHKVQGEGGEERIKPNLINSRIQVPCGGFGGGLAQCSFTLLGGCACLHSRQW